MSISDIQPVNDSQSNWDIKAALKAVYKPALAAASIGIALAATASYFLASANEETAIEATNYAMVPLPSSGAVSTVQDVGTAGMALLHGLTGLAVAALGQQNQSKRFRTKRSWPCGFGYPIQHAHNNCPDDHRRTNFSMHHAYSNTSNDRCRAN